MLLLLLLCEIILGIQAMISGQCGKVVFFPHGVPGQEEPAQHNSRKRTFVEEAR